MLMPSLWVLVAGLVLAALLLIVLGLVLLRKLRVIVIEIYKRLEAIEATGSAVRHAVGGATDAMRGVAGAMHDDAAALRRTIDAARAERVQDRDRDRDRDQDRDRDLDRDRALAEERQRRLASVTRLASYYGQENVRAHLDALRAGSAAAPEISYALARVVRSIAPRIIVRGDGDTILCSLALGEAYRATVLPALTSQQFFAAHHGLSYAVLTDTPPMPLRPPAWMKIPLMLHLLQAGYRRVFYIDADALVTRLDVDIAGAFDGAGAQGLLKLTEDEDGINSGVVLLQDGPAIRRLLDLVWLFDVDVDNGTWEQFALKTLMDHSNTVCRHVTIEPDPRRFNSFPAERRRVHRTPDRNIWRPGDFICHFSGIRSPDLDVLLRTYATQIAPLPSCAVSE